jgi:hypothetical protein
MPECPSAFELGRLNMNENKPKKRIKFIIRKAKSALTAEQVVKAFGARIMTKEEVAEFRKKHNIPPYLDS